MMRSTNRQTPPAYRSLVKLLHALVPCLILLALIAGNSSFIKWGFVAVVGLWVAGFWLFGLLAKPGPALSGAVRNYFVPMHLVMMGLPLIFAVTLFNADPGPLTGSARTVALTTLGAGLVHGIFHLWRHTSLGDGALRNMTPRILHGLL
jgi:cytochrome b561